jgi:hypothetical protein
MYDIKYFFSIKLIRQSKGDKKIFREEDKLSKILFFKIQGATAPGPTYIHPWIITSKTSSDSTINSILQNPKIRVTNSLTTPYISSKGI